MRDIHASLLFKDCTSFALDRTETSRCFISPTATASSGDGETDWKRVPSFSSSWIVKSSVGRRNCVRGAVRMSTSPSWSLGAGVRRAIPDGGEANGILNGDSSETVCCIEDIEKSKVAPSAFDIDVVALGAMMDDTSTSPGEPSEGRLG